MPDPAAVRKEWARRIVAEYEGWARRVARVEVEGLAPQLRLREQTGETARALQAERAYWGLDPEAE
jgi:hypothetical protein